jgi:two-component system KDP operon response regulator KdpE
LLIDDDDRLSAAVAVYLRRQGYEVASACSGEEGLRLSREMVPNLVLLDVMMPDKNGWDTCRELRSESNVPIIMLTARADETDRIHGLKLGADDYIAKPFSLKELEARIEAVLRRANMAPPVESDVLHEDEHLIVDRGTFRVMVDGEAVTLTATERRLLFVLAENANRVLSPDQILRQVWGPEYVGQSDYVKLYIWRVRQKIEPDPSRPSYILTERGLGYRFAPRPVRQEAAAG